jgi:hypothetical protein
LNFSPSKKDLRINPYHIIVILTDKNQFPKKSEYDFYVKIIENNSN